MSSLFRRRDLVMQSVEEQGYITNGLIFFLDGLNQGGVSGHWIDVIGGHDFTLTNCKKNANNVYFKGSSVGICTGAVSSDYNTETIETAVTHSNNWQGCTLLYPPTIDNVVGIGFIFGKSNQQLAYRCNAVASTTRYNIDRTARLIAMTKSMCVTDKATYTTQSSATTFATNTTGNTYVGRKPGNDYAFIGYIYAIRVYNRQLTEAEIKHNQEVDKARYGAWG